MSKATTQTVIELESDVSANGPTTTDQLLLPSEEMSASDDLSSADVNTDDGDDAVEEADAAATVPAARRRNRPPLTRIVAYVVLPIVALALSVAAGYLKWQDGTARDSQTAAADSVRVATESTIAMLSYRPDTAEKDLNAAADRLTGAFRDQYNDLIKNVVIPGAQQDQISAVATVPAAASVSATRDHAEVLVFINQTTMIGNDPPATTTSCVSITLEKSGDRWLVSQFEPV